MGMGCGAATAAALTVFHDNNDNSGGGVEWIHGIEPSRSQRDAATLVLDKL